MNVNAPVDSPLAINLDSTYKKLNYAHQLPRLGVRIFLPVGVQIINIITICNTKCVQIFFSNSSFCHFYLKNVVSNKTNKLKGQFFCYYLTI